MAKADGAPMVVAVRDAYRSDWQRAWLQRLTDQRPDAVVVALGMPADLDLVPGPAVAAHGAARANTWPSPTCSPADDDAADQCPPAGRRR